MSKPEIAKLLSDQRKYIQCLKLLSSMTDLGTYGLNERDEEIYAADNDGVYPADSVRRIYMPEELWGEAHEILIDAGMLNKKGGMKKTHELKTWPEYFDAVSKGVKTFEVQFNDRDFQVGDRLLLKEYSPNDKCYTGNKLHMDVTYILKVFGGLPTGWVVMGIKKLEAEIGET